MKVLERILFRRIRKSVEMVICKEKNIFHQGKGMTDGMFTLRQLVEKMLEVQLEMTVPIEIVMVTLRWMGVPEAEVRLVEGIYKETKGIVLVGLRMSGEFSVNIGLKQGSSLSPLMFVMVMELVSRKVKMKGILAGCCMEIIHLAVVAESEWEMQEVWEGGIWEALTKDEFGED
uniref:Reverse transcriptase domain-containing protein n=1 Tax=Eptatretus burgeri TaxID=7764 RepID=A0A8C4QM41_EPTBU